jgi:hypothetical protein
VRDPNPVVYLMPASACSPSPSRQGDGPHFRRVLRQRHQCDARRQRRCPTYVGLPEQEAFDIEYWLLEEAKLQRMPKPKPLAGRIAFVTGGAGGIGRRRRSGCCRKAPAWCWPTSTRRRWPNAIAELGARRFGKDVVRSAKLNVTEEAQCSPPSRQALRRIRRHRHSRLQRRHFLLRADRGHRPGAVEPNIDILATGYFLVSREAFRTFKQQQIGGNMSSSSRPRTASRPRPTRRPIAPPRPPRSISRAASRWKARTTRHPRQHG